MFIMYTIQRLGLFFSNSILVFIWIVKARQLRIKKEKREIKSTLSNTQQ